MSKHATTVGVDLGDRFSYLCFLGSEAAVLEERRVRTTSEALREAFADRSPVRIALEVGTHSPWVSRLLDELGHEVLVANARKVRLVYAGHRKNDRADAEVLARLAQLDPALLGPIRHRDESTQRQLMVVRARAAAVRSRTQLINHVRGSVKSLGLRLPSCSSARFFKLASELPSDVCDTLAPLLASVRALTETIAVYDCQIAELGTQSEEVAVLQTAPGVGPLTSLTFIATLEDPTRFASSRDVGPYLGLASGQNQSGDRDPQQRITKAGDPYLCQLLVAGAHYILGRFGPDCHLRRWGLELAARGGANAKKRAVVAVARKLAVMLHRMWVTGESFQPFPARS